ncbi:MAG: exopolysaccharide biosynthesis protein [Bauldia sp.]
MTTTADTETREQKKRGRTRRVSAIFRELAARPEERITIYDIDHAFGDRSFSAILLVFGLLTMAAVIPGSSVFTGAPLFIVSLQMVSGATSLWLPAKIGERSVRPADIARLNEKFLPLLRRVERLLVPRLSFMFSPFAIRVLGVFCLILSVIIVLPIPLGNLAPGLAVALIALSLLTRDGLASVAGIMLGIGAIIFLILFWGTVGAAVIHLLNWILPGDPLLGGGPPPPPPGPGIGPGPGPGPPPMP